MYLREKYKNIRIVNAVSKNIFEDIFILPSKRKGYAQNDTILAVPNLFYHMSGVFDGYSEKLVEFDKKLSKFGTIYQKVEFDNNIDQEFIQSFNACWTKVHTADVRVIVRSLSSVLNIVCTDIVLRKVLSEKLSAMLKMYMKQQTNLNILKNSVVKILFWCKKYFMKIMTNYDIQRENPKIFFYGQIYRDDLYFLILMFLCSADVVYFNPTKQERFPFPMELKDYIKTVSYPQKDSIKPIFEMKNEIQMQREATIAYEADKEIKEVLNDEQSGIYRNWQFENYLLKANTIKTTYDEISIMSDVEARFRHGFKVDKGQIFVPNIFAKISGVTNDRKEYFDFFDKVSSENAVVVKNVPFTVKRGYYKFSGLILNNDVINKEKIKKLSEYKFSHIRETVQNYILNTIQEVILKKDILFKFSKDKDIKTDIIYEILTLEKEYLDILQNFDFPYKIPKIIIFHQNENVFTKTDAIRIAFFLLAGFDVLIFTPSGYNDVETVIINANYDVHKLESFDFNLNLEDRYMYSKPKKKGFFEGLFG